MSVNRQDFTSEAKKIENLLARANARAGTLSAGALWQGLQAFTHSAGYQGAPADQTGPASTVVAAMVLWPRVSGLFEVSMRVSWADNTTADLVTHSLYSKQGAGAGALAGGNAEGKSSVAVGAGAGESMVLNVDATGGPGLTFEGSSAFTILQHQDAAATLTGLLSGNNGSTQHFSTGAMLCDAAGSTSNTRTPFTLGLPCCFALVASATHLVHYNSGSLSFWARELPR